MAAEMEAEIAIPHVNFFTRAVRRACSGCGTETRVYWSVPCGADEQWCVRCIDAPKTPRAIRLSAARYAATRDEIERYACRQASPRGSRRSARRLRHLRHERQMGFPYRAGGYASPYRPGRPVPPDWEK